MIFNVFLRWTCGAALLLFSAIASAQTANPAITPWQRIELGSATQRYPFAIYSNQPWGVTAEPVRSAVLVFHGMGRNARGYFAAAEKLLGASGSPAEETVVIAPNYFATEDAVTQTLDGLPLWRGSRWNSGQDAANWPWRLSAFQPIDDLLAALLDARRYPRLKRIVLAGHSAGGQLVHRYAVLNVMDEKIRAAGKSLSYVIANPSSYLYFTAERPHSGGFAPYDVRACPDYNTYRYGIDKLPPYASASRGDDLFRRYAARDVTYLLGTADNDPNHSQLDKSCGARAGGIHRMERGRHYLRYERYLAKQAIQLNRRAYEVLGVGHSQGAMFGSKCGAAMLFGMAEEKNVTGAACRSL
jgi:predicted esterase